MICLSEEESEKFKQHQAQYSELEKKHNQSMIECNQAAVEALRSNPYVDINNLKIVEEYNKVVLANKKTVKEYNNLIEKYNQISTSNTGLTFIVTILVIILGITYFTIFLKWIIKVERKMSKRDLVRTTKLTPITFAKRTNPKKGDHS